MVLTIFVASMAKIDSNNGERLPDFIVHQNDWETEYCNDIKQHGEQQYRDETKVNSKQGGEQGTNDGCATVHTSYPG